MVGDRETRIGEKAPGVFSSKRRPQEKRGGRTRTRLSMPAITSRDLKKADRAIGFLEKKGVAAFAKGRGVW